MTARALHSLVIALLAAWIAMPGGPAHAQPTVVASDENSAGLEIRLAGSGPVKSGASLQVVVTTRQRGYLILLTVDPAGEVRQIFPALQGDVLPFGANDETNAIRPGRAVTVPDASNVLGNFELFAGAPGKTAVIALSSPVPVQVIGIGELPGGFEDVTAAVKAVFDMVKGLVVVPRNERSRLATQRWSGVAMIYQVE